MAKASLGRTRPESLARLLSRQYSVISLTQAKGLGLSMSTVHYRIRPGGPWQQVLPGVYLTVSGQPTIDQLDMAAVLYAGPRSAITGPAALRRWRVGARDNGIVDVLVPRDRRTVSRDFVRVHRTARMPKLVAANGEIQLVLVAGAVIDAGLAIRNRRELRALIAGVVQRGHYTPTELTAELEQSRARNASLMRSVLAEVAQGIRSAPEGI